MPRRLAVFSLLALSCVAPTREEVGPAAVARAMPALAGRVPVVRRKPAELGITLPVRGDGALRLSHGAAWIEITPLERAPGLVRIEDGLVEQREVAVATDVLFVSDADGAEEIRVLRDERAPTVARSRLRASPGLRFREVEGALEAIDGHGRVLFVCERPFLVDARGVRRDVRVHLSGDLLTLEFDRAGLTHPIAVDPTWALVAAMSAPRAHHTVTLLSDGKVLAIGGDGVSSAESYDLPTNKWTSAGALGGARAQHTASLIAGGKVLVAGGENASSTSYSTAQIYDPASGFGPTIAMTQPRSRHTATVLLSGKVLIVGGSGSSAEIFDPTSGSFTVAAPMTAKRASHTASLLPSGKVLVVGGTSDADLAEIYDPAANSWASAASGLSQRRAFHGAATLPTGNVLVFGGAGTAGQLSSADLFDASTSTWKSAAALPKQRSEAVTVTLTSGAVFYATGVEGAAYAVSAGGDLFDPVAGTWAASPPLNTARWAAAGARIGGGRVLIAGGGEPDTGFGGGATFSSVEIFDPGVAGSVCKVGGDCASGACADGVCCDRACDGQCEACDLPGKSGTCSFVTGAPKGTRPACSGDAKCTGTTFSPAASCDGAGKCSAPAKDCGAYACTVDGCRDACTGAEQCAQNHVCSAGKCVPQASAVCEKGNAASIAGDGTRTACHAYLCDSGSGHCRDKCTSTADCATGFACDGTMCTPSSPAASADEGSSGCRFGHGSGSGILGVALLALALGRRSNTIARP